MAKLQCPEEAEELAQSAIRVSTLLPAALAAEEKQGDCSNSILTLPMAEKRTAISKPLSFY